MLREYMAIGEYLIIATSMFGVGTDNSQDKRMRKSSMTPHYSSICYNVATD